MICGTQAVVSLTIPRQDICRKFTGNFSSHTWLKFKEWTDQYSPLFHVSIAGRDHYVSLTEKVTNHLLHEKVTLYSSREQTPAAAQPLGVNLCSLLVPCNRMVSSNVGI